jgi:hypothetical protein
MKSTSVVTVKTASAVALFNHNEAVAVKSRVSGALDSQHNRQSR